MSTIDELRAAHADAVQERAALQKEIDAYRASNPKGPGVEARYLTDGDGIPNTMDHRRVTLDAQVDLALHALNEALAESGGSVATAGDEPQESEPAVYREVIPPADGQKYGRLGPPTDAAGKALPAGVPDGSPEGEE